VVALGSSAAEVSRDLGLDVAAVAERTDADAITQAAVTALAVR